MSSLFKDMADLVATQGTILDRIDHNISSAISYTKQANEELVGVCINFCQDDRFRPMTLRPVLTNAGLCCSLS